MEEESFVVTIILGFIALIALGFLVSIAMGKIDMAKAERKSLAILSGVVLISIAIFMALS